MKLPSPVLNLTFLATKIFPSWVNDTKASPWIVISPEIEAVHVIVTDLLGIINVYVSSSTLLANLLLYLTSLTVIPEDALTLTATVSKGAYWLLSVVIVIPLVTLIFTPYFVTTGVVEDEEDDDDDDSSLFDELELIVDSPLEELDTALFEVEEVWFPPQETKPVPAINNALTNNKVLFSYLYFLSYDFIT